VKSIPVSKTLGDSVFAASINQRGSLEIKVGSLSQDTTNCPELIHSVERSDQPKKSSYQHFAERYRPDYIHRRCSAWLIIVAVVPGLAGAAF
jgi:Cd2+/Zn2+-exporting ATPase